MYEKGNTHLTLQKRAVVALVPFPDNAQLEEVAQLRSIRSLLSLLLALAREDVVYAPTAIGNAWQSSESIEHEDTREYLDRG